MPLKEVADHLAKMHKIGVQIEHSPGDVGIDRTRP